MRPPANSRPPSPALRPGRRWVGLGVRHALFPDSLAFGAQLRSSSLLAASSPTLHRPARTCGSCSALQRSRPPGRVTFRGRLVERGFSARLARPSVDGLPPDRAGAGCDHPFPACFRRDRLVPPGWRLRRAPHVTGLASFLSSCVSFACGRRRFRHPPPSDLIALAPSSRLPAGLGWPDSLRGWALPLACPGCEAGTFGRHFDGPIPSGTTPRTGSQ